MLAGLLLLSWIAAVPGAPAGPHAAETFGPRLIAHAMGGIEGRALTNSADAFEHNYARGFRWFEVDLSLTADGGVAAVHDWEHYYRGTLGRSEKEAHRARPVPLAAFRAALIDGRYRSLDAEGVVRLLEEHPDARIVLDPKVSNPDAWKETVRQLAAEADASPQPGIAERIVPQIHGPRTYRLTESIRLFPAYILTLYGSRMTNGQAVAFVRRTTKIRAVAMPLYRASPSFVSELKRAGIRVYVHTVNDRMQYERLKNIGVDGVYTDYL
jgi:glycerophosphoryl diester phosphodiesterase